MSLAARLNELGMLLLFVPLTTYSKMVAVIQPRSGLEAAVHTRNIVLIIHLYPSGLDTPPHAPGTRPCTRTPTRHARLPGGLARCDTLRGGGHVTASCMHVSDRGLRR